MKTKNNQYKDHSHRIKTQQLIRVADFFPGVVFRRKKTANFMYFLSNLCIFCVISFADCSYLGKYRENLCTYCVFWA